eukprot:SAG11_NODE_3702_length_2269_cov_8.750000_4_plen_237_part_00
MAPPSTSSTGTPRQHWRGVCVQILAPRPLSVSSDDGRLEDRSASWPCECLLPSRCAVRSRIEMLPSLLTCDLCSLRSDVDRLAFTTVWELDKDSLEIISADFHRSVIKCDHRLLRTALSPTLAPSAHMRALRGGAGVADAAGAQSGVCLCTGRSCRSFTYGEAQLRMDDPSMQDQLTKDLRTLNRVAKKLRADRFARGALTLASPEVRFQLDSETQNPNDVAMYELKEVRRRVLRS